MFKKKRVEKKVAEKVEEVHPIVAKKVERSLNLSRKEAGFASGMNTLAVSYFTPYALALNATSSQIGVFGALAGLLPSLSQWWAAKLVEKYSRKRIVIISAILQGLILIPIILAGVLFFLGMSNVAWIVIGLASLFYAVGAIGVPAWFSWMGSMVPETQRGNYFSKRNSVAGFWGIVALIGGGFLLDYFKGFGYVIIGFGVLFGIAFLLRLIAVFLMSYQYEPTLNVRKKDYFSFWQFLKKARETPFGRFTFFTMFFRIAMGIATPFFAVYLLQDLGFSYVWFVVITVAGTIFQLMFLPAIGKFSDRFGNVLLLKVCTLLMVFTPALWIVSAYLGWGNFMTGIYLAIVPGIIGGFGWAGFNLATNNYIYDSVKDEKRSFGATYFNLMNGVGIFIGGLLGSVLVVSGVTSFTPMIFIFGVSTALRFLVVALGAKELNEVRHVKHFKSNFIYREIVPVQGLVRQVQHFNHHKFKLSQFEHTNG